MLEQAKLLGVGLALFGAIILSLMSLVGELRSPWPIQGSDAWTQLAIAEQPPVSYLIKAQ